ncbi:hypothetical protein GGE67_003046 [Rhizobium leucaenae]|uniref:Uncharacterized protein n=1 Tax=Rhizobium leucaenae TaxID=29450 RepID=A0A7W6ZNU2_9HYPH|nr:hypothetical protein [Rhizobium leucaenae]MBB6302427.1 hypothetical protein [Rhizobium leucaenae]
MIGPNRLEVGRKPVDQISALSSMSNVDRRFKHKGVTVTLFREPLRYILDAEL